MTGLGFIVQSNVVSPAVVDRRVEGFLGKLREILAAMEDEEYASHIEAVVTAKTEPDKRLAQEVNLAWGEIVSKPAAMNFGRRFQHAKAVQTVTKAESPCDANIIWVGTDDGALWRTNDGGHSWDDLFEGRTIEGEEQLREPGPVAVAGVASEANGQADAEAGGLQAAAREAASGRGDEASEHPLAGEWEGQAHGEDLADGEGAFELNVEIGDRDVVTGWLACQIGEGELSRGKWNPHTRALTFRWVGDLAVLDFDGELSTDWMPRGTSTWLDLDDRGDLSTNGPVYLINAQPDHEDYGQAVPIWTEVIRGGGELNERHLLIGRPRALLAENCDYVVVVTDEITWANGSEVPVERSVEVALDLVAPETSDEELLWAYHAPVRTLLSDVGIAADEVLRVWQGHSLWGCSTKGSAHAAGPQNNIKVCF